MRSSLASNIYLEHFNRKNKVGYVHLQYYNLLQVETRFGVAIGEVIFNVFYGSHTIDLGKGDKSKDRLSKGQRTNASGKLFHDLIDLALNLGIGYSKG